MDTLTGRMFAAMVNNGCKDIKAQYEKINDLNVFPVPDGDTGTNITATITGGVRSMEKADIDNLSDVASKLAGGMLLGARGNSGVIVSQFFSGVADGLQGLETANITQFASALRSGTAKAYKAVVKPVEGTILTVAKDGTNYVLDNIEDINDFEALFHVMLKQMRKSLRNTPNLLPVLKEAGVIDSGGAGLVAIIEGMYKQLTGEEIEDSVFNGPTSLVATDEEIPFDVDSVLEYGYCTEFILQLLNCKDGPANFKLDELIKFLETLGDSIVAIQQDTIVKVHVHTKTPGLVMNYVQQYGEFITWKMENMSIQHNEVLLKEVTDDTPKAKVAVVAVAPSEAISELFINMGVAKTIIGGQTMNPSAEDFVAAFHEANAETIIVFPNNSNVILTAEQAGDLFEGSKVVVVHTKSVIEAYSALGMVDFVNQSIDENLEIIQTQVNNVISCSVSTAVRDSINNGIQITKGDFIGICHGKIVAAEKTLMDATKKIIASIEDMDDRCVFTVFYGQDADEESKNLLREYVGSSFSLMDFVEIDGNQPVYPFFFAIE